MVVKFDEIADETVHAPPPLHADDLIVIPGPIATHDPVQPVAVLGVVGGTGVPGVPGVVGVPAVVGGTYGGGGTHSI